MELWISAFFLIQNALYDYCKDISCWLSLSGLVEQVTWVMALTSSWLDDDPSDGAVLERDSWDMSLIWSTSEKWTALRGLQLLSRTKVKGCWPSKATTAGVSSLLSKLFFSRDFKGVVILLVVVVGWCSSTEMSSNTFDEKMKAKAKIKKAIYLILPGLE